MLSRGMEHVFLMQYKGANLGFRKDDRSYVIGFLRKPDYIRAVKHASNLSDMKIISDGHAGRLLHIEKRVNINHVKYDLEVITLTEFVAYPYKSNVNIALATDLSYETPKELVFDVEVIKIDG
jgi:hypothetical protein